VQIRHRTWTCVLLAMVAVCPLRAEPQEHGPAQHPAAAHDPHAAAAEPISPFAGDLGNVLFTLLIFFLLLTILGKTAWRPLLEWQVKREESIRATLEKARREREAAEKLLAEYRRQIDHARHEATAIVEEGRRDAGEVRRRIHEEARQEGQQMLERARREIRLATDAAVAELYQRTADLAIQVASGVIEKSLDSGDHRRLVDQTLQRMTQAAEARRN
jgi:F-type H+-transporting ATPase subunit b